MPRNTRSRQGGNLINLYSVQSHGGDTGAIYMRQVKMTDGLSLVEQKKACYVYGPHGLRGGVQGVRLLALAESERVSQSTLSAKTSLCASGAGLGKSYEISNRHLLCQEQAERDRLLIWPLIGDDRAVSVRPKISVEDRKRAEALLQAA